MSRLTVVMASRKLVQIWTENLLFQQKFTVKKGRERLRSKRGGNVKRQKISTTSLNGKLTRPSEESEWLTKKMYKAEAEVEARNCERRNSDIAFQDINQEFEPQRFSATSSKSMTKSA